MSVHIEAEKGAIAETVLLPGDPLRAQWIANTFLENVVCYNKVRGMFGFTGYYKGKRISVQASGMGVPSALIYYHELINDYGVKNLIRVGTAGSYQKHVKLKDIVIAMAASSTSAINAQKFSPYTYAPTASYNLFEKAIDYAKANQIPFHAGNVLTADVFYDDNPEFYKIWADYGVLCVEMETAGLYSIASKSNVNALTILTISDSLVSKETTSAKERESTFDKMIEIALNIG
ncbi:purine-nucleoside phosphorylase [Aestuariibaculum sp. M13]|uniref:purine-nucleoside phosphorylase n=1 Tax=Aestuariibaculum sp. M13 TaxID=2967132 RepID=UPI00215A06C4|nr:purine-nucleoside phosphorylase [Aestuariibaculum sp. M13]MCR8668295.1 purine-nucleoside phosphorylase [Aestuariibaculum sp. M13]